MTRDCRSLLHRFKILTKAQVELSEDVCDFCQNPRHPLSQRWGIWSEAIYFNGIGYTQKLSQCPGIKGFSIQDACSRRTTSVITIKSMAELFADFHSLQLWQEWVLSNRIAEIER